jgi:anaerobic magnesium-protoporphyrin IX monomethyl ester cyclase
MWQEASMADVLLTHSNHIAYDRKQVRKMEPYPPLGTLYAAGLLRERGISVAVFDCMLQDPLDGLKDALRIHRPKVVAIYEDDFNFLTKMCLTRMRELAWEMIDLARANGAHVVVHGSDATDHADDFLDRGAEFVLEGESEQLLLHVVNELRRDTPPAPIPGVISGRHRHFNQTVSHNPIKTSRQIPVFPFPARDLIDLSPYRKAWRDSHGVFSLNLIASRGCPFRCNWCAKPIFGDSYQLRSALDVAIEMRLLKEKYQAEHLWFADDIFGLNRHWLQDFAAAVENLHCAIPFKIQARADLVTSDTANALKRAGCAEVWMGVESGSQKVLDAMDKGLQVQEVVSATKHLKRHGIRTCYFLQFGYPGEEWNDIQKTIALVRKTRPDDIGVSFSYPLPNTRFYARVKQQLGAKRNWSDSDDLCVMFKGKYTDQFYKAVRDALHAEVDSWKGTAQRNEGVTRNAELWKAVESLEPISQNANPTELKESVNHGLLSTNTHFIPLRAVMAHGGDAND